MDIKQVSLDIWITENEFSTYSNEGSQSLDRTPFLKETLRHNVPCAHDIRSQSQRLANETFHENIEKLCAILPANMTSPHAGVWEALVESAKSQPEYFFVPTWNGQKGFPLMSAYSTPALKQILKKPPQTSDELELFVQQYPTREVPVDDFRVCLQLTHPSEWKAWGPFLQNPPQVEPRQRSSALCMHDGKLLCLQAHDPDTGVRYIFPPGGGVEPGEEPWHAAMRETLEETGFHVAVPHTSTLIASYLFPWNRHVYWVTTHFFAATLSHKEREILIENDPGMDEVCWINLENIPAAFVFNNHIRTAIEAAITRILRSGRNE